MQPAAKLASCLEKPAAESTWTHIQEVAWDNSRAYEKTFNFIPQNTSQTQPQVTPTEMDSFPDGFSTSVWPTWAYNSLRNLKSGGLLAAPMPFEERFWSTRHPAPIGIQGFICELPTQWTRGENNDSGLNKSMLAHQERQPDNLDPNIAQAHVDNLPLKDHSTS